MFGQTFGHNLLRKYVIYFGTVFNNIWLNRYDLNDNLIQRNKVPINYGPRDKFLARIEGNEDLERPIAIQLPRMAFEMVDLRYDPTRKLNTLQKLCVKSENGIDTQYAPVPYDIVFRLSIMVKNVLDGTYIVEQILPYFSPAWQATLTVNNDLGTKQAVPIILNDITTQDQYEGYFEQRRAIIWELTFTMKALFFGPTKLNEQGIIKQMNLNLRSVSQEVSIQQANTTNSPSKMRIDISPGIDLNDLPVSFTNGYQYVHAIQNLSGSLFSSTELIKDQEDNAKFTYVKEANSSSFTSLKSSLSSNTNIIGSISGSTATITAIEKLPVLVPFGDVEATSDFGFIYDILEEFN